MADDRLLTLQEAQIGALQAYAIFLEELVAAMLAARVADHAAEALRLEESPHAADAQEEAKQMNAQVIGLFERGAQVRLTCAKVGALPLPQAHRPPEGRPN